MREILEKVSCGEISVAEAEKKLKLLAVDELGCIARLDGNRELRKGVPEVIMAEGKTASDVAEICRRMLLAGGRVIVSRAGSEHIQAIRALASEDAVVEVNEKARMAVLRTKAFVASTNGGRVAILTAGTSDIPIAQEAQIVAQEMGCSVFCFFDVGVAGIHRLLEPIKQIIDHDCDVVVVVAGREGALASVVSGLVDVPVIAVPTSNSYGFGAGGVGTLMAMLQSCSLGLAVVNIDGGVAAGAVAALIANRAAKYRM
ncbi:MAG: nickel pincer cofactor biosynthesis protein LarB [Candidatus Bathyarchaeota archaeon]|nr:nickel pincer cofactor biosynthesis protein LarB [Candidatus Bathyarchaeota archaeon]